MKFLDTNLSDYLGSYFNVSKNDSGTTIMKFSNGYQLDNLELYNNIMLGGCDTCKDNWIYTKFNGFTYDKVLVAGLGLGLIPQELYTVKNCSKVDVIEINQDVIDWANNSNHLDSNINIFQGDIYNYTTSDLYDLIIIDTIWAETEMNETQYQTLVINFTDNLNLGGVLYVPVLKKWFEKT